MNMQWLILKQLDEQFRQWRVLYEYGRPRNGWIKAIRSALNMTAEQLAHRLGVSRSRVTQLELAEVEDAVTLSTLKNAAAALDCELIYAVVPRKGSSLEEIIKARAFEIAEQQVNRVAHSMSLEAQSVESDKLKALKEELAKSLAEHFKKEYWDEEKEHGGTAQERLVRALLKNRGKK